MGFHLLDLLLPLLIGLALFGPKALQSLARSVGRGASQIKTVQEQVMAELPLEELSDVARQLPRVPRNPQQALHLLMRPEPTERTEEKQRDAGGKHGL